MSEAIRVKAPEVDILPSTLRPILQAHPSYDAERVHAFVCDITEDDLQKEVPVQSVDIVSMVSKPQADHPKLALELPVPRFVSA